jgi:hypothetical protein
MRASLMELQRALQGLVVMSGDLELMNVAMLNNQVSYYPVLPMQTPMQTNKKRKKHTQNAFSLFFSD